MEYIFDNKVMVTLLEDLIKSYEVEEDNIKKIILARDIAEYSNIINAITFAHYKLHSINDVVWNIYSNLMKNDKIISEIDEKLDSELHNEMNKQIYLKEELEYLKYLANKVNLNWQPKIMTPSIDAVSTVNNYLINSQFSGEIEKVKIFSSEFFSMSTLGILSNSYILFLKKISAGAIFHEFLHGYSDNKKNDKSDCKYDETISIIGEVGLNSRYNQLSQDRISEIFRINSLNLDNLNFIDLKTIQYVIADLIAISYIWKYGNSIDIVESGINIILRNDEVDLFKMLSLLNLREKDIFDSFNNVNKVLSYK